MENLSDGLTLSTDKTSVAVTDGGDVDVTVTAELAAGRRRPTRGCSAPWC